MQASFGQCGAAFMTQAGAPAGGYCQTSCGRCPGIAAAPGAGSSPSPTSGNTATGSSPTPVAANSPTSANPAGCTDQPTPGSSYSCVQQVSLRQRSLLCLGSCFVAHSIVVEHAFAGLVWPMRCCLYDSGWCTSWWLLPDLMRPLPRHCCRARCWQQPNSPQSSTGAKPSGWHWPSAWGCQQPYHRQPHFWCQFKSCNHLEPRRIKHSCTLHAPRVHRPASPRRQLQLRTAGRHRVRCEAFVVRCTAGQGAEPTRSACSVQASFGQCKATFMVGLGSPTGGYCQTTCGRCPGVPAAPVGAPSPGAAGTSPSPALRSGPSPAAGTSPSPSPASLLSPSPGITAAPGSSAPAGCTDLPPPGSNYTCAQQVCPCEDRAAEACVWLTALLPCLPVA